MKGLAALRSSWRSNPESYYRDKLGIEKMWDGELAMLDAIPLAIEQRKGIVVASGHALGKDWTMGGAVPYFLEAWGPCIVITTAPTDRQVKKIMWGEIETQYANAKIPPIGKLLTQEIKIEPNWYAIGFTTKETGKMVGKFQGFHSDRVFVIVSEAQAVPDGIYEQIEAVLTSQVGLMIQIGNPIRTTGHFAKSINDKKNNIVLQMSCLDNPNYKEKKTVVPGLCSYAWVEKRREMWGEDDPRWQGRVLGILPTTSIDTVFHAELIKSMIGRETRQTEVRRGFAIDVARFGDDETVIYGGTNGMVEEQDIYAGLSTTTTAARGIMLRNKMGGGNFAVVDGDGVGGGTIDTLNDMAIEGLDIVEIHSSGKPESDEYQNLRAEMWFTAKKRAEEGRASIPDDDLLKEELEEVKYFINKRGKIQIESKEDLRDADRLGRSPDRADDWIYLQWGFEQADPMPKNKDGWAADDGYDSGVSSSVYGEEKGAMAG